MRFVKMHGCGNDYVFVEEGDLPQGDISELARKVSDRKQGIGSDGLIVIGPSDNADVKMKMYNSDGSVGMMCGNGIRCLSKYAFERGLTIKTRFRVETDSGIKLVRLNFAGNKVTSVTVNMGVADIRWKQKMYIIDSVQYIITHVSMGNPHAVIFVEDIDDIAVERIGRYLEHHPSFTDGVNTEFVRIEDSEQIYMRVWERGSGETLACGTGACASVVAGTITGRCGNRVRVCMPGGELKIEYDELSGEVYMQGEACEVFQGDWRN